MTLGMRLGVVLPYSAYFCDFKDPMKISSRMKSGCEACRSICVKCRLSRVTPSYPRRFSEWPSYIAVSGVYTIHMITLHYTHTQIHAHSYTHTHPHTHIHTHTHVYTFTHTHTHTHTYLDLSAGIISYTDAW